MSSPTLSEPSLTESSAPASDLAAPGFAANQHLIFNELRCTLAQVSEDQANLAIHAILNAPRIFVTGAGRSGLALRMAAMRLMHLGLTVHVAGEVTTPAIASGDLLIAASGSGTTAGVVLAAATAAKVGAHILAITTAPDPPLANLAQQPPRHPRGHQAGHLRHQVPAVRRRSLRAKRPPAHRRPLSIHVAPARRNRRATLEAPRQPRITTRIINPNEPTESS